MLIQFTANSRENEWTTAMCFSGTNLKYLLLAGKGKSQRNRPFIENS